MCGINHFMIPKSEHHLVHCKIDILVFTTQRIRFEMHITWQQSL